MASEVYNVYLTDESALPIASGLTLEKAENLDSTLLALGLTYQSMHSDLNARSNPSDSTLTTISELVGAPVTNLKSAKAALGRMSDLDPREKGELLGKVKALFAERAARLKQTVALQITQGLRRRVKEKQNFLIDKQLLERAVIARLPQIVKDPERFEGYATLSSDQVTFVTDCVLFLEMFFSVDDISVVDEQFFQVLALFKSADLKVLFDGTRDFEPKEPLGVHYAIPTIQYLYIATQTLDSASWKSFCEGFKMPILKVMNANTFQTAMDFMSMTKAQTHSENWLVDGNLGLIMGKWQNFEVNMNTLSAVNSAFKGNSKVEGIGFESNLLLNCLKKAKLIEQDVRLDQVDAITQQFYLAMTLANLPKKDYSQFIGDLNTQRGSYTAWVKKLTRAIKTPEILHPEIIYQNYVVIDGVDSSISYFEWGFELIVRYIEGGNFGTLGSLGGAPEAKNFYILLEQLQNDSKFFDSVLGVIDSLREAKKTLRLEYTHKMAATTFPVSNALTNNPQSGLEESQMFYSNKTPLIESYDNLGEVFSSRTNNDVYRKTQLSDSFTKTLSKAQRKVLERFFSCSEFPSQYPYLFGWDNPIHHLFTASLLIDNLYNLQEQFSYPHLTQLGREGDIVFRSKSFNPLELISGMPALSDCCMQPWKQGTSSALASFYGDPHRTASPDNLDELPENFQAYSVIYAYNTHQPHNSTVKSVKPNEDFLCLGNTFAPILQSRELGPMLESEPFGLTESADGLNLKLDTRTETLSNYPQKGNTLIANSLDGWERHTGPFNITNADAGYSAIVKAISSVDDANILWMINSDTLTPEAKKLTQYTQNAGGILCSSPLNPKMYVDGPHPDTNVLAGLGIFTVMDADVFFEKVTVEFDNKGDEAQVTYTPHTTGYPDLEVVVPWETLRYMFSWPYGGRFLPFDGVIEFESEDREACEELLYPKWLNESLTRKDPKTGKTVTLSPKQMQGMRTPKGGVFIDREEWVYVTD